MTIDPRLDGKYSGRSGDPTRRLGEALAKSAKRKQERDALPTGISGGARVMRIPGIIFNLIHAWRVGRLEKDG